MKKRLTAVVAGVLAASMVLAGCAASKGLETDELTITQYKGVKVPQVEKPAEVTDEEVEANIQGMLQTMAEAEAIEVTDRPVQSGDRVNIAFVGTIDGEEFAGGSAESYDLVVGSGSMIPGFEDSIIGHSIGETFDWNGSFPEDYAAKEYAGKACVFTITVNSIAEEKVPELTDEVVQKLSEESKTVEEYKAELKKQMTEENENNYKDTLRSSVWQQVVDNTTVKKYPEDEIKEMCDSVIDQYKTIAETNEMEYKEYIEGSGQITVEEFEKQVEDAAKESKKQTMIAEAIAKKEKIEVTDKIYKEKLEEMAKIFKYEDVEAFEETYGEEDLKKFIANDLVLDWLVDHCIQEAAEK